MAGRSDIATESAPRVLARRLASQRLSRAAADTPAAIVAWLGAVQAQDYAGGKWAIGLRGRGLTDDDVERAIEERAIVRTWPMRGTLHFVAASDVRWMLALCAPRMIARAAGRYRELGLDDEAFTRARRALTRALRGGRRITRPRAMEVLAEGGVDPAGQRGIHVLGHLAQRGVLCLAARVGKQPAFALLDEWLPAAKPMKRPDAIAELGRRYVTSHGPATLHDFAWWSGLTLADARSGLEASAERLEREVAGGRTLWSARGAPSPRAPARGAILLPPWDEFTVAYRDRSDLVGPGSPTSNELLLPTVLVDGQPVATWKRTLGPKGVTVSVAPRAAFGRSAEPAVAAAAARYAAFLGRELSRIRIDR